MSTVRTEERVGVLGGTFDPVHNGHLVAAAAAHQALDLDRVLLMPAGSPWQKREQVIASPAQRLELVEVAIDGIEGLEASSVEVDRPGPTYTVDTLELLAEQALRPYLILGADVAARLNTWHRPDEVRKLATIVAVDRGEIDSGVAIPPFATRIAIPCLDISSTGIRDRLASGRPIAGLVPTAVIRRIEELGLYTRPR